MFSLKTQAFPSMMLIIGSRDTELNKLLLWNMLCVVPESGKAVNEEAVEALNANARDAESSK